MHSCILHVENVGQDIVAAEVEEAGAEGQEEQQPQEYEVADQVKAQTLEANFANSDPQQGKPRFIDPMSYKFKFMQAPVHITHCLTLSLSLYNYYACALHL